MKLVFTDFALSSCAASCSSASCSYVELYDGGSANSPLLGRFCRGSTLKETYSSGHQMFLKFRSGQTVDRGFEAMYSVVSTLPTTATPATPTPPTTPTTPISDDGKWPEICHVPSHAIVWLHEDCKCKKQEIHPLSLCHSSQSLSEHCQTTPIQTDRYKDHFVYRSHKVAGKESCSWTHSRPWRGRQRIP